MKKKIMTSLLLMCAFALGANAQLLYKISGKGLTKPSYIFGTHHLAGGRFVDKIAGIKDAVAQTEQVYGEVSFDDMMNPDSLKQMQNAMMLPEGQSLKTILTPEQYKKFDDFLVKTMGVGMSNPQIEAQFGRMTPATLATQLTVLMYLMRHPGEFDPNNQLDHYFQKQAKENHKPVGGFETLAFQSHLLFNSKPIKRQIEELMCLIDHEAYYLEMVESMSKAYNNQDIKALKSAMDTKLGDRCDATPEEEDALLGHRNANWLRLMPAIMQARPTLFVVGAGHLPGDKGVLEGLRKMGYQVE